MNTDPLISLIFVNYQSARYLKSALISIFSLEKESALFEILVVNNDQRESGLLKKIQETLPFILIENAQNNGFGAGNNLGAQKARGSILGFINPDTIWTETSLRRIGTFFEKEKKTGILSMTLIDQEKKEEAWGCGYEPTLLRLFRNNIFPENQTPWNKQGRSFPDWVSGCGLFIQKDLFFQVEGFDEQFFLYFEDVDLCKKVREAGFIVERNIDFPLIHFGGKSIRSNSMRKKQFYLSQKKYYKKHRPVWENIVLSLLHFFFLHK